VRRIALALLIALGWQGGGQAAEYYVSAAAADVTLQNNIIMGNKTNGLSGTCAADYNCVWGNSPNNYTGGALAGAHDVAADPLFEDGGWSGFRLRMVSPCVDAGTAVPMSIDLFGNPRPRGRGYDIGCYEYPTPPEGSIAVIR
jgi:hypothetical protein